MPDPKPQAKPGGKGPKGLPSWAWIVAIGGGVIVAIVLWNRLGSSGSSSSAPSGQGAGTTDGGGGSGGGSPSAAAPDTTATPSTPTETTPLTQGILGTLTESNTILPPPPSTPLSPGSTTLPAFNPNVTTLPAFNPNVVVSALTPFLYGSGGVGAVPSSTTLPTFTPGATTLPTFNPALSIGQRAIPSPQRVGGVASG